MTNSIINYLSNNLTNQLANNMVKIMLSFFIVIVLPIRVHGAANGAANSPQAGEETIYISVKSTKLRSQPKQYAAGVVALNYGDSLTALESKDGWFRVRGAGGKEGYVHSSAVTPRKVVLKSNSQFRASDYESKDVVLAGKGVNPEVEKLVAQSNGSSLFLKEVDRMEKININEKELATFIQGGKLG